jgi:hypothetical protein
MKTILGIHKPPPVRHSPSRLIVKWLFVFILIQLAAVLLHAQEPLQERVSETRLPTLADTLSSRSDIDTVVIYSATDSIIYSMRTRFMNLYGQSDLHYRTMGLKAERVAVNWDTATLFAEGVPDTADSTGKKISGKPVLNDGGERYDGSKVIYNFRTKKGKITVGETEIEDGYYRGEEIKKIDKDILFVADGLYTTCDASHPHFYFYSPKMKIIMRDHIVAEPIYFYIADVPLFALPFGVFPNKSGRRSGLIAPTYGYDARLGHFLSHFGYYWAISDYFDLTSTFDWFTRGGWMNQSQLRYALRYDFTGSLNARVSRRPRGEPGDPDRTETRDYNIQVGHNQQIDPTSRLDVNFIFSTGTFYRNFSTNLDEILTQNISSRASYMKTWEESNRSLSLSIQRDQSLTDGSVTEILPSLSFAQGQIYPFRKKNRAASTGAHEASWYEQIGFNYGASVSNNRSRTPRRVDSIKTFEGALVSIQEFQRSSSQSVTQSISTSIAPKFGEFTVSPSLNLRDERSFGELRTPQRNEVDSTLVFSVSRTRRVRGSLSSGIGVGTRFYGIFQPRLFGVTAIRHTVTPNVNLTYSKQIYGEGIRGYSLAASMNAGNNFEMKYQPSDTAKEEKIQLMNVGASASYDFARDSMNLSDLSIFYRTEIGRFLSLSASTVHSFYQFDSRVGHRVNKFLLKEKGYLADLTSVSLSLNSSLSGEKKAKKAEEGIPAEVLAQQQAASGLPPAPGEPRARGGLYGDEAADFSIPWSLSIGYTFSQSQSDPRQKFRTSALTASLTFSLTENWRFAASGSYDFVRKKLAAPSVNVSRDLHCWIMNFTWYPIGINRGYHLEIRVKAPQLQDIKVTKQGSARGVYY